MLGETKMPVLDVRSVSPADTLAFGRRLGALLRPGDAVLMVAPFGAGKTHLTKGIAAAWGVAPDDVNSPSFVLVNQYDGAPSGSPPGRRVPIYHADLYRIEGQDALETVGLDDLLSQRSLVIVEWAEHAGTLVPAEHLAIMIEIVGEQERVLRLQAHGARYEEVIEHLRSTTSDA